MVNEIAEAVEVAKVTEKVTADQVLKLKEALEQARIEMMEMESLIGQITAMPLDHAVVTSVHHAKTTVKVGDRVMIRPGSQFEGQSYDQGTVVTRPAKGGDGQTWVRVEFDDGDVNEYHAALVDDKASRQVDLVLVDGSGEAHVTIFLNGRLVDVAYPKDGGKIRPGDAVLINRVTSGIVKLLGHDEVVSGPVVRVSSVRDDMVEVESEGTTVACLRGTVDVKIGDRVLLDPAKVCVSKNLGQPESSFRVSEGTRITWDMIGGLQDAKMEVQEAVEMPYTHPAVYAFYNKKPAKGILLYGPPGCGKTMLGKAAATAVAMVHGTGAVGFFYIKAPELLNKYVGETEFNIRSMFELCKAHKEQHGHPAVLFVDEADALLNRRGSGISSDVDRTIVPAFLTEMDGLEDSAAIVILATNRHDTLDPAVLRDGRIDRKIRVGRPGPKECAAILEMNLDGVPLANGSTHAELATCIAEDIFGEHRHLADVKTSVGQHKLLLGHAVSGAMVAGVVEKAVGLAIRRDISTKKSRGLEKDDLSKAVEITFGNARQMDNRELCQELAESLGEKYEGAKRAK